MRSDLPDLPVAAWRLRSAGWDGTMPLGAWATLLQFRRDFDALARDPHLVGALVVALEAPAHALEDAVRHPGARVSGERRAPGGGREATIIASRCARWREGLSAPHSPAGPGNDLGVTGLTLVRAMEAHILTVRDVERAWLGLPTSSEGKALSGALRGRNRICQRHAEEIARRCPPVPDDMRWCGSS